MIRVRFNSLNLRTALLAGCPHVWVYESSCLRFFVQSPLYKSTWVPFHATDTAAPEMERYLIFPFLCVLCVDSLPQFPVLYDEILTHCSWLAPGGSFPVYWRLEYGIVGDLYNKRAFLIPARALSSKWLQYQSCPKVHYINTTVMVSPFMQSIMAERFTWGGYDHCCPGERGFIVSGENTWVQWC